MTLLAQGTILTKEEVAPNHFAIKVQCPEMAAIAQPGQFVQIRVSPTLDPFLRRPLSIYGIDREQGTLSFLFHRVGRGTEILAQKRVREELDLHGPLGRGFAPAEKGQRVILVGGGIGVAPLIPLAQALVGRGSEVTALVGARTGALVVGVEALAQAGAEVQVATDDGSRGHHGLVTQLLLQAFSQPTAMVYACGPKPMLRAVASLAIDHGVPCQVSLEERMGCGIGGCLSCVCKIAGSQGAESAYEHKKVCTDGPVFWAQEVVWE